MKHIITIFAITVLLASCEKPASEKVAIITPPAYDTAFLGTYNLTYTSDIPSSGMGLGTFTYRDANSMYFSSNSNYLKSWDSIVVKVSDGFIIIEPQKAINSGFPADTVTIVGAGSMIGTAYFMLSYTCTMNGNVDAFDMSGQK
jgi:hypothetical protein